MRNEMRIPEHFQSQNLVTFCAFRLYTQRERVPLQSSLHSGSHILKPEGTIRSCLLTFCVTRIIKYCAEIFVLSQNIVWSHKSQVLHCSFFSIFDFKSQVIWL